MSRPVMRLVLGDQAADALVAMQRLGHEAVASGADGLAATRWLSRSAYTARPCRSGSPDRRPEQRDDAQHNALAAGLRDRQDDYLGLSGTGEYHGKRFRTGYPMIKLRQKVSGCLRTLAGARQFCAIRSYLSTAAKHGRQLSDVLVMLAEGRPAARTSVSRHNDVTVTITLWT